MAESVQNREVVLSVRDASIYYRVVRPVAVADLFRKGGKEKNRGKSFHAVKGVSFDIHRGEIVGMIGKNGSGKSTLLRAMANIYAPDTGSIETFGHSVNLMAIGVGFVNSLSGRENIILSGLLMGFSRDAINGMMDEIIELGKKHQVRLRLRTKCHAVAFLCTSRFSNPHVIFHSGVQLNGRA